MPNPEIECRECDGNGEVQTTIPSASRARMVGHDDLDPSDFTAPCPACNGAGWRPMTDEERDDAAADAFSEQCSSEPPITMDERHAMAWREKMGRG
jgi:RecJ-like exonuclease